MNSRAKRLKQAVIFISLLFWLSVSPILKIGPVYAAEGDFAIALSNPAPVSGSTITASISVSVGGKVLAAYDIAIKYNPAVLQATGVTKGTSTAFGDPTFGIFNDDGEVTLNATRTTLNVVDPVSFAIITFNVVGAGGSSSTLDISVADVMDENFVTIGPDNPREVPGVTTVNVGDCGDVNLDKKTNMVDAMFVAQFYAGLRAANELALEWADVDLSGAVDLADALKLAQYSIGLISQLCQ